MPQLLSPSSVKFLAHFFLAGQKAELSALSFSSQAVEPSWSESSSRVVSVFGEDVNMDQNALEISPEDAVDELIIYQVQGSNNEEDGLSTRASLILCMTAGRLDIYYSLFFFSACRQNRSLHPEYYWLNAARLCLPSIRYPQPCSRETAGSRYGGPEILNVPSSASNGKPFVKTVPMVIDTRDFLGIFRSV